MWYLRSLEQASVVQKLIILEHKKWSSIVQYSCTSIWDLKYTFPKKVNWCVIFSDLGRKAIQNTVPKILGGKKERKKVTKVFHSAVSTPTGKIFSTLQDPIKIIISFQKSFQKLHYLIINVALLLTTMHNTKRIAMNYNELVFSKHFIKEIMIMVVIQKWEEWLVKSCKEYKIFYRKKKWKYFIRL